ncbi:MAG: MarR family transcriptional regulator [Candidatus Woesearchaeota archaeon]
MENKYVGLMIIGVALVFFLVVMSFNNALEQIVNTTCTHGPTCPMYTTLSTQKIIGYSLIGLLVLVGLLVTFFIREKKLPAETKKVLTEEEKKHKLQHLDDEEKRVMELLINNQGSMYQSDVLKETQLSKVKVTRILDKLEGKQLLERKRRGMTNIVILK